MMPMYRYMDSEPYQRNQAFSFPQYYNPGFRANFPVPVEPWQQYGGGGSYGYPMQCHSCCNHNNIPGYSSFRPSYPRASMPSPVNFCGGYPIPSPYHEGFHPVHYVPLPPHYSMDIPKYEYDKSMLRNYHCCGCPNHSCHQNVDKGVKIEEQRPNDVEKKVDDSLVPVHMKNYPYPIMWIPPESMSDREQRRICEPEFIEERKIPSDSKAPESLKSQEDQRHTWFPLDLNEIGSLMKGGRKEKLQDQHMEDEKKELPFPIFWMPSREEAANSDKGVNASQDQQSGDQKKQFPFPFFWLPNKQIEGVAKEDQGEVAAPKVVPLKNAKRGDVTNQARVNEEKPADVDVVERKEKTVNQKSIPVKQTDQNENKSEDTEGEGRGRSIAVNFGEDNVANKPSSTSVRRQSASPRKTSELPPVCLRVDPLPRKKKSNGSSRSPSPPGPKALKQEALTGSTSLELQEKAQQNIKSQNYVPRNIQVEPSRNEKVIKVVGKNISDDLHTSQVPLSNKEELARKRSIGEPKKVGGQCEIDKEDQGGRKVVKSEADNVEENNMPSKTTKSAGDGNKLKRKTLSDLEAAVLIQSAYRGFEVRRCEPLKKLKQIAEVREQVDDVRNRITFLEASGFQKDDKEKVVIGETIMRLLLKLDTIQGLLPSLRDIRKSLARELVILQEKLDDLIAKTAQVTTVEASILKHMEELGANANNSKCLLEQQKDEATGVSEGPVDGTSHHDPERCLEQVQHINDSIRGNLSDHGELHKATEDADQELLMASGLKSEDGGELGIGLKNDVVNGQHNALDMVAVDAEMGNGSTELKEYGKAPSVTEASVAGTSSQVPNTNTQTREFEELIRGVVGNELAISEPEKDAQVEMSKNEVKQTGKLELKLKPDETSPNGDVTNKEAEMPEPVELPRGMIDAKEAEMPELAELPRGITDDDGAVNEVDDVSQSGEEERQMAFHVASQQVETQNVDELEEQGEEVMEEQPIVPPDEQVEVESRKDEELPADSVIKVEVELPLQKEVSENDFLPVESVSNESQPLSLPFQTETYDVVHENGPSDMVDRDNTVSSVLAHPKMHVEDQMPIETSLEDSQYQLATTTLEDGKMQESKVDYGGDRSELAAETIIEDGDVVTLSIPVPKSESLPVKSIETKVSSIDERILGDESDRKIIEENEKLREMMQTFMEAGNQQLQVISELAGRVKDLEKKLARKKKGRGKRCRAAAAPPASCVKTRSNNS